MWRWPDHLHAMDCPQLLSQRAAIIDQKLLPSLTGHTTGEGSALRLLQSVPARSDGMAIHVPAVEAEREFKSSRRAVAPPVALIQCVRALPTNSIRWTMLWSSLVQQPARLAKQSDHAKAVFEEIQPALSPSQKLLMETAGERGVSSWLTADPSTSSGTVLNKSDFRDAACIRYGLLLDSLPTTGVCGATMTVDHATCPAGGYSTARNTEVQEVLAAVLRDVARDVRIDPRLLPFAGEYLAGKTANRSEEARLDIRVGDFRSQQQDAFFDIRVTHPRLEPLSCQQITHQLQKNEKQKHRSYSERIIQIGRGSFTSLVFATNGIVGKECSVFKGLGVPDHGEEC